MLDGYLLFPSKYYGYNCTKIGENITKKTHQKRPGTALGESPLPLWRISRGLLIIMVVKVCQWFGVTSKHWSASGLNRRSRSSTRTRSIKKIMFCKTTRKPVHQPKYQKKIERGPHQLLHSEKTGEINICTPENLSKRNGEVAVSDIRRENLNDPYGSRGTFLFYV